MVEMPFARQPGLKLGSPGFETTLTDIEAQRSTQPRMLAQEAPQPTCRTNPLLQLHNYWAATKLAYRSVLSCCPLAFKPRSGESRHASGLSKAR
ncbi:MAG: hypothetical protein ABIG63_10235 [Chloroflexota bacterium]